MTKTDDMKNSKLALEIKGIVSLKFWDNHSLELLPCGDLLMEAARRLEAQEWREIQTAPKDGTEVLLSVVGYHSSVHGWFSKEAGDFGFFDTEGDWNNVAATHWRPLPEGPKDE